MTCCALGARTRGGPTSLFTIQICVDSTHFMLGSTQMCGRDRGWGTTCCRVLTPRATNNFPVLRDLREREWWKKEGKTFLDQMNRTGLIR